MLCVPCSYILVIEKDAVFQRLLEDSFPSLAPIMVTGKGMPDMATREFVDAYQSGTPALCGVQARATCIALWPKVGMSTRQHGRSHHILCRPAPGDASASYLSLQVCALVKDAQMLSCSISPAFCSRQLDIIKPSPPNQPPLPPAAMLPEIANAQLCKLQCTWLYRCAACLPAQCLPCPACGGPGGLESIWCSHSCNLQDGQHAHGAGVDQASLHHQFLHWQAISELNCVEEMHGQILSVSQQDALFVPAACQCHFVSCAQSTCLASHAAGMSFQA